MLRRWGGGAAAGNEGSRLQRSAAIGCLLGCFSIQLSVPLPINPKKALSAAGPCEPDCYGALLPCWLDTNVICNQDIVSSTAPQR